MGVKQLWTLLGPVGRPVLLETMEGKTMAIDSSIWIYQFQATMRDKEGRALVNAHVLGFLRRICKLLFYGIKPVFVFDGGAPALKRMTITERKRKKAGAADSHARVAEKLLAAHMRREAIGHVQKGKIQGSSNEPQPVVVDEDTVYLEDLENNMIRSTPTKGKGKEPTKTPESGNKKAKFHDHDPYRLPDVDLTSIAQPTSSLAPDPRLATEDELRTFIDAMRPEDFDVSSPAFRDLPTEVQYEIIGDLRLKSRQTSYKRLQTMLRSAPTPLDFSKAQIRNLQQRNALTQQLLETTDSIGKANVVIPVRIASERNKEYVLVKNQGEDGGWVLGIRDEGTQAKPIVIDGAGHKDSEEGDDDSEMEMEEVAIPGTVAPDPDLREYHGRMALASIAKRHATKKLTPRPLQASRPKIPAQSNKTPLFLDDDGDLDIAIRQSLDQQEADALEKVIAASRDDAAIQSQASSSTMLQPSVSHELPTTSSYESDDDNLYVTGSSRLETALAFANTSPSKRILSTTVSASSTSSMFGTPALLLSEKPSNSVISTGQTSEAAAGDWDEDEDMEEILTGPVRESVRTPPEMPGSTHLAQDPLAPLQSDDDMEEIPSEQPVAKISGRAASAPNAPREALQPQTRETSPSIIQSSLHNLPPDGLPTSKPSSDQPRNSFSSPSTGEMNMPSHELTPLNDMPSFSAAPSASFRPTSISPNVGENLDEEEFFSDWERSPSPAAGPSGEHGESTRSSRPEAEDWDAAQEMDVAAEEGGFAEFMSQVKGQDLEAARRDIDEEIRDLNKQKKVAMRDSDDITQQMISQIMLMLRLFGIPYITAPMEAEAQCAALVSLGLVEGIITDDSDVFLFGGMRVFKNMFNQSKTVECFLLSDLARELGLERDKLVRLAYLLGSDYVDGLPGVGPVVAMELMKEFPGENGLHKFKEWWQKVQNGKDTAADTKTKFRKRFKKKYKDLYLPDEWPNPAVRDAYYHPAVDGSEEPFKWGLPDLDALQDFFHEELGWHQGKVDDLLLPIIRKMGQRGQAAAANRQGTLDGYLDVSLGNGTYAPRKRQAYSSKRLQQVVADFRAKRSKLKNGESEDVEGVEDEEEKDASLEESPPKKKRKGKEKAKEPKKAPARKRARGGKTQRGRVRSATSAASSRPESEHEDFAMEEEEGSLPPPALAAKLRPRPKPIFKGTTAGADEDEDDQPDSDDDFVIKRRRKS